jgi:hypothetical protein
MKILAIEKDVPGKSQLDFESYLKEEALEVWRLCQNDIIREIYFDNEKHCAVLILECKNKQEALNTLNCLPLVTQGLIDFDVITLIPYPGFARLFK